MLEGDRHALGRVGSEREKVRRVAHAEWKRLPARAFS